MKYSFVITLFAIFLACKPPARSWIPTKSAGNYVDQYEQVCGYLYKREIRATKSCPDSVLILTYLSGPKDPETGFIEVMKLNIKGDSYEAQIARNYKAITHDTIQMRKSLDLYTAEGKIVLFEGNPAIITNLDHFVTMDRVSLFDLTSTGRLSPHDCLPADEAIRHIGEIKRVYGYVNDGKVLQNKDGSFTEILYLGNSADHPEKNFALISTGFRLNGWDLKKYQNNINFEKGQITQLKIRYEVTGRICIYKQKPAIATDYNDVATFERKD